jgi:transposase-like protein
MVTSKQWISAEELASMLCIDTMTAWLWNHKFRKIMVLDDRTKLSWDVEVDEVFIWWKHEWVRGRWAKWKIKIIIAVEINTSKQNKKWLYRGMWRIRIKIIPNCWEKTLTKFIEENIEKDSTIYTDKWLWYINIDKQWYKHIIQSGSIIDNEIVWINTWEVTPNVHIIASLLKRWLLGTHQKYLTQDWYLQDYLEEYTFRFNRRKSSDRWKLFRTLIEQIMTHSPTTKKQIKTQATTSKKI